jgi:ribosomal protein S18 acetylase RimI-like enzyme
MATEVSPGWLTPAGYIAFLNRVFPGQWDPNAYQWYIARSFNGRSCDLLVDAEDSTVCAGFALVPRQTVVDDGAPIDVGVVCAAATLPGERGRGRYARLLRAALERGRQRGYAALLGFVTADNASGRGLLRLGARAIPSFYLYSAAGGLVRGTPRARVARREAPDALLPQLTQARAHRSNAVQAPQARFHYADRGDWMRQFLHRPHPVRAVRVRHDSVALLEAVGPTERLQCLACPDDRSTASIGALAAASAAAARSFFMYTLDACQAAAARRLGLRARAGYLMLLPTGHAPRDWQALASARWFVQSGDRL